MENIFYLLSAHTTCIEGICLSKKNNNVIVTKDCVGFSKERSVDTVETSRTETEQWAAKIGEFLDQMFSQLNMFIWCKQHFPYRCFKTEERIITAIFTYWRKLIEITKHQQIVPAKNPH